MECARGGRAGIRCAMAPRILIVEDEFLLSVQLEGDLRAAGYQTVGPCNTLEAARQAARSERFDVAVLDVNLNGERVFPLADDLAARKTPFILLSGYAPSDLPERFRNAPQVSKPYDPAALNRRIEQMLSIAKRSGNQH